MLSAASDAARLAPRSSANHVAKFGTGGPRAAPRLFAPSWHTACIGTPGTLEAVSVIHSMIVVIHFAASIGLRPGAQA
jgi:hypothetical protein